MHLHDRPRSRAHRRLYTARSLVALPELSIDTLLARSRDGSWHMQLRPLNIRSGEPVRTTLQLQAPMLSAAGDIVLSRTEGRIQLDAQKLGIDLPTWPGQVELSLSSTLELEASSLAVSQLSLQAGESASLSLAGQAGWVPNWDGQLDWSLSLSNSLAPLGGQGPNLSLSGNMNLEGSRIGVVAEGRLHESPITLQSGICLNSPPELGVDIALDSLDLADWVLPGQWPSPENGDEQAMVLAARVEVAELIDADLRARQAVIRWRSRDDQTIADLLECRP